MWTGGQPAIADVTVTDHSDAVRYSLLDGNDSSLFAIEETSGELFYVGAGEDFEGGVTSYELTASGVTVTDAADAGVRRGELRVRAGGECGRASTGYRWGR